MPKFYSYVNPSCHLTNRAQAFVQNFRREGNLSAEFIDGYRLLVAFLPSVGETPYLLLKDFTEGVATHTVILLLSPDFANPVRSPILLERGAYKPSIAESLTPFYPDPLLRCVSHLLRPTSLSGWKRCWDSSGAIMGPRLGGRNGRIMLSSLSSTRT